MSMSYGEYVQHYFEMPQVIVFILLAAVLLGVVYGICYLYARRTNRKAAKVNQEFFSLTERFYEVIFSGGSIIGFMAIYYLINRFVTEGAFYEFWSQYKDYLLLVLMVISILFNTLLDHVVVKLRHLDKDDMASIRLTGMLYMILIFGYIKFIYEDDNYDMFITYFLTLMIGRFVYFDASFKDFLHCVKKAAANIPIMIMALVYLGIMCAYGYSTDYLLKHNGVITNIFFTHLFMIVVIFALHFIPDKVLKSKKTRREPKHKRQIAEAKSEAKAEEKREEIEFEDLNN
ncbi:MAG: hypothetical protein K6E79_02865 [Pseudobutyrivibrio sp.]|nr:hypothetical protein [Pseudobutyrivibrio sp.]